MAEQDQPQIYLISPPELDLKVFSPVLARVLAAHDVACFRLALSSGDEDLVAQSADHLRQMCHEHDVAIVIQDHFRLVDKLGLDGCHLSETGGSIRDIRKELGAEAIVGAYCGTSRHVGMSAAEAGADYVSFGPIAASGLGSGETAELELFSWWSEMIEVPVIAEGGFTAEMVNTLAPISDFLAFGSEIWNAKDPQKELEILLSNI